MAPALESPGIQPPVHTHKPIGYNFGRRLFMASGVPIGLTDTSIGGTTAGT